MSWFWRRCGPTRPNVFGIATEFCRGRSLSTILICKWEISSFYLHLFSSWCHFNQMCPILSSISESVFDFILIITAAAAVVQCFCNRLQSFLRNWKGFGDILDVYRCDHYQTSNVLILNSGSVDFISTQEVKKKKHKIRFYQTLRHLPDKSDRDAPLLADWRTFTRWESILYLCLFPWWQWCSIAADPCCALKYYPDNDECLRVSTSHHLFSHSCSHRHYSHPLVFHIVFLNCVVW